MEKYDSILTFKELKIMNENHKKALLLMFPCISRMVFDQWLKWFYRAVLKIVEFLNYVQAPSLMES